MNCCRVCQSNVDLTEYNRITYHGDGTCKGIGMCYECGSRGGEMHHELCSAKPICTHPRKQIVTHNFTTVRTFVQCLDCGLELDGIYPGEDWRKIIDDAIAKHATKKAAATCPNHWTGGLSGICPDCGKP